MASFVFAIIAGTHTAIMARREKREKKIQQQKQQVSEERRQQKPAAPPSGPVNPSAARANAPHDGETLREKAARKLRGKGANPSQLGDPVSMKAETSENVPIAEEEGSAGESPRTSEATTLRGGEEDERRAGAGGSRNSGGGGGAGRGRRASERSRL